MRSSAFAEFISIDGVFEDPGGAQNYEHGGWTFEYDRGEDGDKFKMGELMEADVQLFGRRTYVAFAAARPKYVVSNTLTGLEWQNTTVISGDAVALRLAESRTVGPDGVQIQVYTRAE